MLFTSVMPLGMLVFWPLVEAVRIEPVLVITGALMFIVVLSVLWNKKLIHSGAMRA
jgi:hypothetical protein